MIIKGKQKNFEKLNLITFAAKYGFTKPYLVSTNGKSGFEAGVYLIPSFFIRCRRVETGRPTISAAPPLPPITPRVCFNTFSM
jgi:hypothetical protein